jgi:hypothetical protein
MAGADWFVEGDAPPVEGPGEGRFNDLEVSGGSAVGPDAAVDVDAARPSFATETGRDGLKKDNTRTPIAIDCAIRLRSG